MKSMLALLLSLNVLNLSARVAAESRPSLTEGNRRFLLNLLPELGDGNVFFSPYSISSALSMTYGGARGETETEMRDVMHLLQTREQTHSAFRNLREELEARALETGQQLSIANGLCLVMGDVNEDFKALLTRDYAAEIFPGDLEKINNWVKDKTRGRIHPILDRLPGDTAAVILNAIYFKGAWADAFEKNQTRPAPFHLASGESREVNLMHRTGEYAYLETDLLQAITIPYQGGRFSMTVLLPRRQGKLADLEKELQDEALQEMLTRLDQSRRREVHLRLPRFRMETEYQLAAPMQALGMKRAFDPLQADFSGMAGSPGDLFIGAIVHKAFVEVNEEGTEAAAATAVVMRMTSVMHMQPTPEFRADHPFLFLIREHSTGAVLFTGRLSNPAE